MPEQTLLTLVNSQNGNLAFKLFSFDDNSHFDHVQRNNYYSLIWVMSGTGQLKADFSEYTFEPSVMFAFSPYQPFMLSTEKKLKGVALQFHPDFFCIHRNHSDVNCDTVLFNNIYRPPFIYPDEKSAATFLMVIGQIKDEIQNAEFTQHELLIPYLKIFLVTASRLMLQQRPADSEIAASDKKAPLILQDLTNAIEKNFKQKHSASDYADTLNISANALAKITKSYFNKTLTDMISERIIIEAKRELYLTSKPVKEIAYHLGYTDEYYFSRFFKVNAGVSPQIYRDTVGFARAEAE